MAHVDLALERGGDLDTIDIASRISNAKILAEQGEYADARGIFVEALRSLGPDDTLRAEIISHLNRIPPPPYDRPEWVSLSRSSTPPVPLWKRKSIRWGAVGAILILELLMLLGSDVISRQQPLVIEITPPSETNTANTFEPWQFPPAPAPLVMRTSTPVPEATATAVQIPTGTRTPVRPPTATHTVAPTLTRAPTLVPRALPTVSVQEPAPQPVPAVVPQPTRAPTMIIPTPAPEPVPDPEPEPEPDPEPKPTKEPKPEPPPREPKPTKVPKPD